KSEAARRREPRAVVPPSVQELNDSDLFAIKRTITVSRRAGTPEPKREVLYDSEGLSFEGFSDREHAEFPARKTEARPAPPEPGKKEKERKRSRAEERPAGREKYKKKFKDYAEPGAAEAGKSKEKAREKSGRKGKAGGGHKDGAEAAAPKTPAAPAAPRKVKLQSKVSVLIREGVSSTTTSTSSAAKEGAGSGGAGIGVKFARDAESRAAFLKTEEKAEKATPKNDGGQPREAGAKPRKAKPPKTKGGVKKVKLKTKGEARKKRKTKAKNGGAALKKSKADSCSQSAASPQLRLPPKPDPAWSGSEKSTGGSTPKPPSPLCPAAAAPKAAPVAAAAAAERELTPDSQTVDSSCKTPDVSFLPEEGAGGPPQAAGGEGTGSGDPPGGEPEADSHCEGKEEAPRAAAVPGVPAVPGAATGWSLQGGVDCATSGVLALTALLFKMEEANLASRAKAQELIQATNQVGTPG
ncbi:splicing factor, arginine/serine-rich 19, partial [Passer montanus]|uniref:splicing factor, arginine/serine-rich 19 n=1 Tax=Passer montanus TaxID=9160 RepID=UPI0019616274